MWVAEIVPTPPDDLTIAVLLVLPDGELHEYLCGACNTSLGTRRLTAPPPTLVR